MDPINLKHEMDDLDYACFLDLIRKKSGLEIPAVRRPEVERSIHQLLSQINLIDVRELLGLINQDKRGNELLETLIGRITIGETYFFRNHSQFEALETTILPEIINRRRTNKQLRIWSAGCSTGEEPYSLAILLKKLLPDWSEWNIFILATDINRNALEKAQKREFGASSFRKETPPDIKQTYFATNGNKYILKPSIAEMVNFNYLNLVEDVYPSFLNNTTMMDLILCRNVFIYFKEETSQRIANALYDALGENGWLIVGHAEPSQTVFQKFRIHNFPGTIIYQKSEKGNHTPEITTSARVNRVSQKIEIRKNANRIMPGRIKNTIKAGNITQNVNQVNTLSPVDATGEMLNKDLQEADRLINKGSFQEALNILTRLSNKESQNALIPYYIARTYASQQRFAEAVPWIELAIEKNILLAPAHYLHGVILQESGEHQRGLAAFRKCLFADPKFLLAYFSMAGLFRKLSQPQKAVSTLLKLEEILKQYPMEDKVPSGDGITISQLFDFVSKQKELIKNGI